MYIYIIFIFITEYIYIYILQKFDKDVRKDLLFMSRV